jgi:hypothetical protein
MKNLIATAVLLCALQGLSAQAHNRRTVIDLILTHSQHSFRSKPEWKYQFQVKREAPVMCLGYRMEDAIPKYALPKCAIICRLEEYVQLHAPFKLNVGVGGE